VAQTVSENGLREKHEYASQHLRLFHEWLHDPAASVVNYLCRKRFAMDHEISMDRTLLENSHGSIVSKQ
jgi:hypothetical protein